jgi:hypothetical protein
VTIKIKAKNELRISPLRFERATTGSPDITCPDIDNRGHTASVPAVNGLAASAVLRGAVFGMLKNQTIKIKMIRDNIDNNAVLYLTSSDTDVFTVKSPISGAPCPNGAECDIELVGGGFTGTTPKSAEVEVRFGEVDGPIIHKLSVYVFNRLLISIQPHLVTINNSTGAGGVEPTMDISSALDQVKALWACCGIEFTIRPTISFDIKLSKENKMDFAEVNSVYSKKWVANTINVYVMQELEDALGYGFSKAAHAGFGLNKPGVFMGMISGTTDRSSDTYWCANDLAHELGHFFTLWHPSDGPSANWSTWGRVETWSMRFLMHNYNQTWRQSPPQGGANWPEFNNFGYGVSNGSPYRAGLISMKNVRTGAGAGRDAQCSTVRNHVAQGPTVLY